MKNIKKYLLSLIAIAFVFVVAGCSLKSNEKVFEEEDLKITLTEDFVKKDLVSTTYYYESMDSIVTALRETYDILETVGITKDSDLKEYADAVIQANALEDGKVEINKDGNYAFFTYEKPVSGTDFYYYAVVKKGDTGFWLFNFACKKEQKDNLKADFEKWAKSIEV